MTGWTPPALPEQWQRAAKRALVGRGRELAVLEDAWAAADAGARQFVVIGGDAGAGKSRLAAEAATALHRTGATVLIGSCVADLGQPYQPFVEPFSVVLQSLADGDLSDGESPSGGRSIVDWLRILTGTEDGVESADAHRAFQRQLYAAAVTAIKAVARRGPLVLILEDLHWSGSAGQQLLTYVVQHTAACRLLIVATYRNALPDRSAALVETIATLQGIDGVRRLDLPPLRSEDIADLLVREAGVPAEAAEAAAALLREQTGGNPYFVGELWRDLLTRGGLRALRDPVTAPASVRDAFHSRLRRLSPVSAEIAELAAVIGEEVEPAVLCAAADRAVADVFAAVDDCVGAGLLAAMADGDDLFRFTHSLARQSILELTPASTRTRHHADVAEVIERLPATRSRVQRLAHHYASAHALGYASQAVHYLVEAAQMAAQGLAHRDAARLYERAAALTSEPAERDAMLLDAVRQHTYAGDFVRARELAEQVATTGTNVQRLSAAIAFEAASWRPGLPGHHAVNVLTAALSRAGPDMTDRDHARVLAGLGRAFAFTGAMDRASVAMDRAIAMARAIGDDELLMDALAASLWERRQMPGYAATVRERAVELSALARRYGDLVLLGPAAHHRTMAAYRYGKLDEMDAAHLELAGVAQSTGQAYFEYFAGGVAYGRQFIAGDFAAAERTCATQLRLGLSFGTNETNGPFGVQTFMVRRETGALEQIRPLITGEEDPDRSWAPGLLALYTEFGMRASAARMVRWILDRDVLCDEASAQWPMVLAFLTEAALLLQDTATAARLRPALERNTGLNLAAEPFVALFGSADRYIGAVDSLLANGDPETSLAVALDMDTRMAAPVHVAQTLAAAVAHHRRTGGDEARIRELTGRARAIAEPLRLRRVLRTLGPAAGSRPAGLTNREVEVLRLISAGLGNREIGARLFITENTAANHVRSILAKTGASNRTQAARYATEHGLLP